ncbi:5-formyltetrahydrofolate cyclo-ligase [Rhodohalobacter sp.]|uniref:5-formyltetrahydrofolate cyclo-ligase n=1 Tax=Rhodohalobacter sp. TaxID=1974210 RepID=UPI002ACDDC7F|nr:5-formyltetrahydrofolate cyclo-ligase [Rhodohalobacter sp.]MDZ7757340.1 5-formyltetrahydrofolate cyclo-ligase [Rhodohalobacter sp.]
MSSDEKREQKRSLRKFYLQRRMQIPGDQIDLYNEAIFEKVKTLQEFQEADIIHIYASMDDRNEVDTFHIMDYTLKTKKRVIVPVMKQAGKLKHCEIDSTSSLKKNSWGVPEPVNQNPLDEINPDIIFVPMVAGDLQKNRLGYGKGYYDRFLASTKSVKAGLLFEKQLSDESIPIDTYDVPLDILITEKRILK